MVDSEIQEKLASIKASDLKFKRRDESIVDFDPKKIFDAIEKAFLSVESESKLSGKISEVIMEITTSVIDVVNRRFAKGAVPIEDIQDQVELALMRAEHHKAARAFVIYRDQREKNRQEIEKIVTDSGMVSSSMQVVKRNGERQDVSLDKITNRVMLLSSGLNINTILIAQKAVVGLFDGISTAQIDEYLAETAAALTIEHPDYSNVAARVKVNALHKDTEGFMSVTQSLYDDGLLNDIYYKKVMDNANAITDMIDYQKDYNFDYFGLTTLMKAYLLKVDGKTVERPQDMWMRTALTCGTGDVFDIDRVRDTYTALSDGLYTHATPTLFNSGLKMQQLSSCFLISMEDDSIDGIFNTLKDTALISKTAGGIGLHAHNIRGHGSIIKSTNGVSNGLIPFLKIFNETARSVDQGGGKRKGSFAVYLEPWHSDIKEFLDLRKNTGAEEFRARDLFYALWIPDLFMERVEQDGNWTLMSESDCPGLSDVYGKEFVDLYTKYESEGRGRETMKARTLMGRIIESQIETGQPYMLYKDSVNEKSNQKNLGVIKSSNLCAEIVEYSDKDETAVCNLASIALPQFIKTDGTYDYEKLYYVAKMATVNLDRVIDVNFYPTPKTQRSNMRHRPIALGVQGLADVFFKMKIAYDSAEAADINKKIFETIYFGATEASMEMARDLEPYETYAGSPMSQGLFQFDMWNVKPSGMWDWDALREKIKQHGVRNSLTTACMPTASTGIILGNTETFQAQTSNIYKRQTLSGEFLLVNKHLVSILVERQLWTKEMRDNIILENGSIQNIPSIPDEIKDVYKTVWETSQKTVINMSADRSPFIDQTQSMNLWLEKPTFGKVNSMHMYAWKKGLKTGMYYLRSRSVVDAVKVTVSEEQKNKQNIIQNAQEEDCLTCSA